MDQIEAGLGDRLRWKCNVGCEVLIRHRSRQCGRSSTGYPSVRWHESSFQKYALDGREGDVARGYKSDYFVGLIRTFKTAIILFDSHKSR